MGARHGGGRLDPLTSIAAHGWTAVQRARREMLCALSAAYRVYSFEDVTDITMHAGDVFGEIAR